MDELQVTMAQVPGARKRRRSTTYSTSTKFSCLLVCIILLRSIWQSVVITNGPTFLADSALPRYLAVSTAPRSRQSRVKRPHGTKGHYEWASWKKVYSKEEPQLPPRNYNTEIPPNDEAYWNHLCRGGNNNTKISSKSRILISGISTHTLAAELALALVHQCHVRKIVGLSAQYAKDVAMNSRIEFLFQRLPQLQFIHHDGLIGQARFHEIIASVRPTHVIHFEPSTFSSPEALTSMPRTMQIRESLEAVERLARAIVNYQSEEKRIRLVFVSAPAPSESLFHSGILDTVFPSLLQTFRKLFHLDAIHLKLPYMYGPFHESPVSPKVFLPEHNDTLKFPSKSKLIHISDSLEVLVAAASMEVNPSTKLPRIQPPKVSTYKPKEILHAFHYNATDFGLEKLINDRTKALIAWYHHDTFSFEDVNNVHSNSSKMLFRKALSTANRRLAAGHTTGISLLQRRHYTLFPCESECAVHTICQTESAWTSIVPISQMVTQDCRFILYTSNFSSDVMDLPIIWEKENVNGVWPRNVLCQVAFVSGQSKLVKSLVGKSSGQEKAEMNGQLKHNQWTLIWLPNDEDETSLSEADLVLPKLSPRLLFTRNVTRGMYIEPRADVTFPPLHIIWYLLAKKMDAKQTKEPSWKAGKVFPSAPPRHVALLSRDLGVSPTLIQERSMSAVALALLKAKKLLFERDLPLRQLEYYDFVKSRFQFHIPDTVILMHNLELDRARRLRCEWYEEHLFWASSGQFNRQLEDLSLGYVLGRWLAEQRLESHEEYAKEWGLRIVDKAKGDRFIDENPSEPQPSQYFVKFDF